MVGRPRTHAVTADPQVAGVDGSPIAERLQHLVAGLDRVTRGLGGLTRVWRFDRMATVCDPGSGRVTASFAGVAKHYGVSVAICPSRRGNRKGVVEKVNHTAAQRWWRTLADDVTVEQAQVSLDRFAAVRGDTRLRVTADGRSTVATVAKTEPLTAAPPLPYPVIVAETRTASRQALVSYRGNRYSVPPQLAAAQVIVSHPVGGQFCDIATTSGIVIARHRMAADGLGVMVRDSGHVIALDAITGKLKWHNDASGSINEKVNSGVSMQGSLFMENGNLCFLGGGVQEVAQFSPENGKCLNTPLENVSSGFRTAFYPYYPEYGNYISLQHKMDDGTELVFDASYEGNKFNYLHALAPLPSNVPKIAKERARWNARRGGPQRKVLWRDAQSRRFAGFIVGKGRLLGVGDSGTNREPFVAIIDLKTGKDIWTEKLPAKPIKGGAAIDKSGRILVSLTDGRVVCFERK